MTHELQIKLLEEALLAAYTHAETVIMFDPSRTKEMQAFTHKIAGRCGRLGLSTARALDVYCTARATAQNAVKAIETLDKLEAMHEVTI